MAFEDLVHGPIVFEGAQIEDFVIVRSDGHPTYHLSVVSDDVEMAITHVVRGDDHIAIASAVSRACLFMLALSPNQRELRRLLSLCPR